MTEMDKLVWAAAYAAEFAQSRAFLGAHGREIDSISGYSCAEVADVALEKYREAIKSDDAEYLTPVKEGW
jgi:hypothetical protein